MERIKLQLTDQFSFSTLLHVRITDLNYGGHVGNDAFLSLLHEARQQFLNKLGYSELNIEGTGLIIADVAIEYKNELNYGDKVKISVAATHFDKLGFDLHYLIEVVTVDKSIIAGKAKTGMVCFDYTQKRKVAIPPQAVEKLSGSNSSTKPS